MIEENPQSNAAEPVPVAPATSGHADVTRRGALDMQVCVPRHWTDDEVKAFADRENMCGTEHGWHIRKQGDAALAGKDERVQCAGHSENVHIMLDA